MHYAYKSPGRALIIKISVIQYNGVGHISHIEPHWRWMSAKEQQFCQAREEEKD